MAKTPEEPISRDNYERTCAERGWPPRLDNHLHANIPAGIYDNPDAMDDRDRLEYRRALTVIAEKDAGIWAPPAKKDSGPSCIYCGLEITRADGECEECGSQTAVAKWLA